MTSEEASVWSELSLRVRQEAAEAVGELVQELTGSGVTIEPPIDALGPDEGYTLNANAPAVLRGYIYGRVDVTRRTEIERVLGASDGVVGAVSWREIREEDWAEAWKTYYDIEHVGRIVIRPEWREYSAQADEVIVSLDPGMAFGTGQHPTTRMCLEAAQDLLRVGDRVLDLGCGSGILSIAAIGLGAEKVVANDIEELAVKAARANVELNGMSDRIEVHAGSIDVVAVQGPFDFVFANINASTVAALAAEVASVSKPGAWMLAGGIIEEREGIARDALVAAGFEIEHRVTDGDWRTFVCRAREGARSE